MFARRGKHFLRGLGGGLILKNIHLWTGDEDGVSKCELEDEVIEVYKSIVSHEYPFCKDERSEEERLEDEVWYASR